LKLRHSNVGFSKFFYIKIIFFYFLKIILDINITEIQKHKKKKNLN
jgi:hypothetical protein